MKCSTCKHQMIDCVVKYERTVNSKFGDLSYTFDIVGHKCTSCDEKWYPSTELDKVDFEVAKDLIKLQVKSAEAFLIIIDSHRIAADSLGISYGELKKLWKNLQDVEDKLWDKLYERIKNG